jgi:hypothetical protein
MQVKDLHIKRAASYEDNANQLIGIVHLEGPSGSQSIRLSNKAINAIFNNIRDELIVNSATNAKMTKRAVDDAATEPLLNEPLMKTIEA